MLNARRTNITIDPDLHALATAEADKRGLSFSGLVDAALRDRLYWKIVSWWREGDNWPYCRLEADCLTPTEAGPAFALAQERLSGSPGLVSVAAVRQGEEPRWTPPLTNEEVGTDEP